MFVIKILCGLLLEKMGSRVTSVLFNVTKQLLCVHEFLIDVIREGLVQPVLLIGWLLL